MKPNTLNWGMCVRPSFFWTRVSAQEQIGKDAAVARISVRLGTIKN
jgi:hypothetical protein